MRAVGLVVILSLMPVFVAALARASQRTADHDRPPARRAGESVPV